MQNGKTIVRPSPLAMKTWWRFLIEAQAITLKQKAVACAISCSQKGIYVKRGINRRSESGTMRSRSFSSLLAYTVSGGTLYGACTGFNTALFGEELYARGGSTQCNTICDTEMTVKSYMHDKSWLKFGNVMCKKLRVGEPRDQAKSQSGGH